MLFLLRTQSAVSLLWRWPQCKRVVNVPLCIRHHLNCLYVDTCDWPVRLLRQSPFFLSLWIHFSIPLPTFLFLSVNKTLNVELNNDTVTNHCVTYHIPTLISQREIFHSYKVSQELCCNKFFLKQTTSSFACSLWYFLSPQKIYIPIVKVSHWEPLLFSSKLYNKVDANNWLVYSVYFFYCILER